MTFSVIGHCQNTGMFGVAITTSSICVGSRCPWVRPGVGACATQNITDPSLGNRLLDLLADGHTASSALNSVTDGSTANIEYRQLTLIDAKGNTASHTGSKTLGTNNVSTGDHCIAAGNLLSTPAVTQAMADAFSEASNLHLAPRLLGALEAGLAAGGEGGPVRSAGLLVCHENPWPLVDLRVDWDDDCPIKKLRSLWENYEPQMADYNTRAINPSSAPAYGVPGDP